MAAAVAWNWLSQSMRQGGELSGVQWRMLAGSGEQDRGGDLHFVDVGSGGAGMNDIHLVTIWHNKALHSRK